MGYICVSGGGPALGTPRDVAYTGGIQLLAGAAYVHRFILGKVSRLLRLPTLGLALSLLAGCAATHQPMGPAVQPPRLEDQALVTPDGVPLPLRQWLPPGPPRAAILALHGMNDYSNAFAQPAEYWARQGIATYAYDQRGFGRAPQPGIWSDTETMVADLNAAVDAIHVRLPGVPLYVLGESMGGAVIVAALAQPGPGGKPLARRIDGAILSAPALWGRQTMNAFYRLTLWAAYRTFPGMALEPPAGLKIVPSDNGEMLRALGRDPLVLKRTRIDAVSGLVDLMTTAYDDLDRLPHDVPVLVLYGQHEQVLDRKSVSDALARLDAMRAVMPVRQAIYARGYHMLLRDRCAATVWSDVASWVGATGAPLPSGADRTAWIEDKDKGQACLAGAGGETGSQAGNGLQAPAATPDEGRFPPVPLPRTDVRLRAGSPAVPPVRAMLRARPG
ncbi:Arylesterase [Bordetella ansorpii]|uniref:Arylesterase n=1 Tax=Bordetella ansorpii TaxID=288768 RepID=A0A157STY3_9BORD|nr:Arylesterase [Bordetella ansorpii]